MEAKTDESHGAVAGQVERSVRRVRAPKTDGYQLKNGDKFTIEGWGKSARGHEVRNGRSAKTGRKMKAKTLQVFVVTNSSA
jgi:hypothetical protein